MTPSIYNQSSIPTVRIFSSVQEVASDVADELRKYPDHWTKGHHARRADGEACDSHDPEATAWCLLGHIVKRSAEFASNAIGAAFGLPDVSWHQWNDSPERTVDYVITLCKRVARSSQRPRNWGGVSVL